MSTHGAAGDKNTALEKRVECLETSLSEATKKATIVAIIAALLGTGGATGLVQLWTGARLARAEAQLKEAEVKYKDREQKLKEDAMVMETRLKEQDVELKQQQHQMGDVDLKMKGLAQYKEEFAVRMQQHQAATDSLEKAIMALKKSGDSRYVGSLVDELRNQNQSFLQFLDQTRLFVQQLPGAPSWYQGVLQQATQQARQHQERLAELSQTIPRQ